MNTAATPLFGLAHTAHSEVSAAIVEITPDLAQTWLKANTRNRRTGTIDVARYARDMAAGDWTVTGEAVKFSTDGTLLDGQHRLQAIVLAGVTIKSVVVYGLDADAQEVMDSGRKRTSADQLAIAGVKNSNVVAAVAAASLKEPRIGLSDKNVPAPSHSEILAFIDENPDIHEAAAIGTALTSLIDLSPTMIGVLWMRTSRVDRNASREFWESLAEMRTDGNGDPRLALARRLAQARRAKERLERNEYASLVFRAWNAWREGRSLHKIQSSASVPKALS